MRIRKKKWGICAAVLLVFCVSATYGYFSDIVTVKNQIAVGDVNIILKEYEQTSGVESPYTNPKTVFPGDVVSKIPRITNEAQPCWIRAQISYMNDREELEGLSDDRTRGCEDRESKCVRCIGLWECEARSNPLNLDRKICEIYDAREE